MAGYSATPLPKKLGIAPGSRLRLDDAPATVVEALGPLEGVIRVEGDFDVAVWFVREHAALEQGFPERHAALDPFGGLWVAWPKRASGVPTDITEDRVRAIGLAAGLVDNKVCAIDETWSGLRLVVRKADRPPRSRR